MKFVLGSSFLTLGWLADLTFTFYQDNFLDLYPYVSSLAFVPTVYLSTRFVKKHNFTTAEGIFINLTSLGSGLILSGLTALILPLNIYIDSPQIITNTFMIGATGGFAYMTYKFLKKKSHLSFLDKQKINFYVNFFPQNFYNYQTHKIQTLNTLNISISF